MLLARENEQNKHNRQKINSDFSLLRGLLYRSLVRVALIQIIPHCGHLHDLGSRGSAVLGGQEWQIWHAVLATRKILSRF